MLSSTLMVGTLHENISGICTIPAPPNRFVTSFGASILFCAVSDVAAVQSPAFHRRVDMRQIPAW